MSIKQTMPAALNSNSQNHGESVIGGRDGVVGGDCDMMRGGKAWECGDTLIISVLNR
jgi:hypothetical protein